MELTTFTVPLSFEAHSLAQQMRLQQFDQQRAKQVYLNQLAVYAVEFYLKCLGIEVDTAPINSRNPIYLQFMDVGNLWIKDFGQVECRPVLPEETVCYIPPETWSNRLAYIAVRVSQSLRQATLLGFTDTATAEFFLDQLQPMENLPVYVEQIRHAASVVTQATSAGVNLRQWFDNLFEAGWQELETLLRPEALTPAFRVRSTVEHSAQGGKVIRLTTQVIQQSVILAMKLNPQSEGNINILVEVHPMSGQSYLPESLQMKVIDQHGTSVMQATAGDINQNIQFDFNAEAGEQFGVELILGDANVIEEFVV
ncbi:MAG: DUF1822 family protein [Trichocoleus desertorum ATA4-8-CV12]|jgi:hypothetical protein|nr:DUF1822 family protein [Trichocoleus desertorum ATA4-8-CV12]